MSLDICLYNGTKCPHCNGISAGKEVLFSANITHNLGEMAENAGIYEHLWRPEELNIKQAKELIKPLEIGLTKLKKKPQYFRKFEPKNKWGTYDKFVPWVQAYLEACKKYPESFIEVDR